MSNSMQDGADSAQTVQDGADPAQQNAARRMSKPLDVVFLQDTTGSQGPYIDSARKAIRDICDKIISSVSLTPDQLRFGLIAFRDHPPQDYTYVTKQFGFTSDINVMQRNLSKLIASGGGDGPEAQTAAIAAALEMEWNDDAVKMAVLITDAPPHGIGEAGDGFTKSPDQNDPLELVRQMAQQGITLFVIACEPALSDWRFAVDFYTALAQITSGRMFPLLMADKLGDYIVGTAVETVETEQLIAEFENVILDDVYNQDKKIDDVVDNLQEFLQEKGVTVNTVVVDEIYKPSATAERNVAAWSVAKDLEDARRTVEGVSESRIHAQYAGDLISSMPRRRKAFARRREELDDFEKDLERMGKEILDLCDYEEDEDIEEMDLHDDEDVPLSAAFSASFARADVPRVVPAPVPPPQATALSAIPAPKLQKQSLSTKQTHRIVMQSLARKSKVTSEGMVNKLTGKVIPSSEYYPSKQAEGSGV